MPRVARAPHSSKVPDACPHCGSHVLTRRGTRRKKLEIVQLWRCASCKRTFTPGPAALRNKTYPLRTVLDALSTYSLGYSMEDTVARVKSKSGRRIGSSTRRRLVAEHKALMSYLRLRESGRHLFRPSTDHPLHQVVPPPNLWLRLSPAASWSCLRRGELDDKRARRHALRAARKFLGSGAAHLPARALPHRGDAGVLRKRVRNLPTSRASSSIARRMWRRASRG